MSKSSEKKRTEQNVYISWLAHCTSSCIQYKIVASTPRGTIQVYNEKQTKTQVERN